MISGMLMKNPECYTLWNYRREILNRRFEGIESEEKFNMLGEEMSITQEAMMKNPKAYCVWQHRFWTLSILVSEEKADLEKELTLCDKLLRRDERNFHCWNYRRDVAGIAGLPPSKTIAFTTERIDANFSNYSAWHQRSLVLESEYKSNPLEVLRRELDTVGSAAATEPADQSVWIYTVWLVKEVIRLSSGPIPIAEARGFVLAAVEQTSEIWEMEPECKWSRWLLWILHSVLGDVRYLEGEDHAGHLELAQTHREALMEMDPLHKAFYSKPDNVHCLLRSHSLI